jgi:nicotinate-nucleotide adenylyltransferase
MTFFLRAGGGPERLGVLPGTFNPLTVAHVALGRAALAHVDEVVFALPRHLPHKKYTGATFAERVEMLSGGLAGEPAFSVASPAGGLFREIAEECRQSYSGLRSLSFICGRDAAERIVEWDYGEPDAAAAMLRRFDLLVACRGGNYVPPAQLISAIRPLTLPGDFEDVSATEVRTRIAGGLPWEYLVPPAIVECVRKIYSR